LYIFVNTDDSRALGWPVLSLLVIGYGIYSIRSRFANRSNPPLPPVRSRPTTEPSVVSEADPSVVPEDVKPILITSDTNLEVVIYRDRIEITHKGRWGTKERKETLLAQDIAGATVKGASKQLFITTVDGKTRAYNIFKPVSEEILQAVYSSV